MKKADLQTKILALDPEKEYIIVVGKESGLTGEDLASIRLDNRNVAFLKVYDIHQIEMYEYQAFQLFMKHQFKGK